MASLFPPLLAHIPWRLQLILRLLPSMGHMLMHRHRLTLLPVHVPALTQQRGMDWAAGVRHLHWRGRGGWALGWAWVNRCFPILRRNRRHEEMADEALHVKSLR